MGHAQQPTWHPRLPQLRVVDSHAAQAALLQVVRPTMSLDGLDVHHCHACAVAVLQADAPDAMEASLVVAEALEEEATLQHVGRPIQEEEPLEVEVLPKCAEVAHCSALVVVPQQDPVACAKFGIPHLYVDAFYGHVAREIDFVTMGLLAELDFAARAVAPPGALQQCLKKPHAQSPVLEGPDHFACPRLHLVVQFPHRHLLQPCARSQVESQPSTHR